MKKDTDIKQNLSDSVHLYQKSMNKVTINMYDKDLIPLVDDLYINDQSNTLLSMKQEGAQEEINKVFQDFASSIESQVINIRS